MSRRPRLQEDLAAVAGCRHARQAFSRELAEQLAAQACLHLAEPVVAHQCPDKVGWHVGSDDQALSVVRAFAFNLWCKACGRLIPDDRLLASLRSDRLERYCSDTCK